MMDPRIYQAQANAHALHRQLMEQADNDLRMCTFKGGRVLYDRSNGKAWIQYEYG